MPPSEPSPLSEIAMLVLTLLSDEPAHAYALLRRLRPSRICSQSSLYTVIRRLLEQGLLTSRVEPGAKNPDRHVLSLTGKGRELLSNHGEDWETRVRSRLETLLRTYVRLASLLRHSGRVG